MGKRRPAPSGYQLSPEALVKRIMERRERYKDDPRAWFAAFPDPENFLRVVRFVGARPHPIASRACEDFEDALVLVQILRRQQEEDLKLAELAVIEAAHRRKMEWATIGKAMGFRTNRRQQAFVARKRLASWAAEDPVSRRIVVPAPRGGHPDPIDAWRAEHSSELLLIARQLLEHRAELEVDPDVADSLEILAEAVEDHEGEKSAGRGLAGILRVISDECDKAKLGSSTGQLGEILDQLRTSTRAYRAVDQQV